MSTSPDALEWLRSHRDASAEAEAIANALVVLVEEFEATMIDGHLPPGFAERLAQLRQTAERLVFPFD